VTAATEAGAVTAVIIGAAPGQETRCRAALAAQERPPQAIVSGRGGLAEAAGSEARWLWLLDGGAAPRPDALARLLAAVGAGDARGPAVLVAGLVLDDDGQPRTSALPAGAEHDTTAVLALASQRLLPVRRAGLGCTLVARTAFWEHGLPQQRYGVHAGAEWSARLLSSAPGLFVPAAIAVGNAATATPRSRRELLTALRTARTQTWTRGEAVRAVAAVLLASPR
jgi:hypothetical protein